MLVIEVQHILPFDQLNIVKVFQLIIEMIFVIWLNYKNLKMLHLILQINNCYYNKNEKGDSKVRRNNTSKQKMIEYMIKRVRRQEKKKKRKRRGRSRQCSPRTPTMDTHRSNKSIRHVYEHNLFFLFLWHLSSRFTRYSLRYSLFIAYRLYALISLHIQHVNQFI